MIRIVTDSTCDLPAALIAQHGITVVPVTIQFGTDTFTEGVDITPEEFYHRVEQGRALPTTSQPSPGAFFQAYQALADAGAKTIVSAHVSAKLSGTCSSAELAWQDVADRVRVHVFDSGGGSAGLGFMVLEAARMAERGAEVAEILERLETLRQRIRIYLTVADLKYPMLSGRVSRLQGALASLLDVKPIIALDDGRLDVRERARSRRKAVARLLELAEEVVGRTAPVNVAAVHARDEAAGAALLEQARQRFNIQESFLSDLALSVAVHLGPGAVGIVIYQV